MNEINQAVAAAQTDSSSFGMVPSPAPWYSMSQQTSQTWTAEATTQFTNFADNLYGTAQDYVETEQAGTATVSQLKI